MPDWLSLSFIPGVDGEATGGFINLPAVVLVLLCMLLLLRGASESATINAIMVLIKVGVLIQFIIIGFSAFQADHFSNFFSQASGISAAAATIFFSFIGLDAIATAGEEVENPQKALPRALIGALIIVTSVDVLVAIAGLAAEPVSFFSTPEAQEAGLAKILNNIRGSTIWGTVLRRTHPEMERPFKVPLYPFVPILSIAACVYILAGLSWITWVIFGVWILIVIAFYWLYGRKRATLNQATIVEELVEPGKEAGV